MSKLIFIISILMVLLLSACSIIGSGNVISEPRPASNFDRVSLSGLGELILTQSGEEALTIEADDNIMQFIRSEVRGDTLFLGFIEDGQGRSIQPTEPIRFNLSIMDINAISLSGSTSLDAGEIDTDHLEVSVSGSGQARIDSITAESLIVEMSGAVEFDLAGRVVEQNVSISGSGSYRARDLDSRMAKIVISGFGDATVRVEDSLEVRLSGFTRVDYYGVPRVDFSSSGFGSLNNLGR